MAVTVEACNPRRGVSRHGANDCIGSLGFITHFSEGSIQVRLGLRDGECDGFTCRLYLGGKVNQQAIAYHRF